MAENTGIEWARHTYNPWIGCTRLSAACDNCYAEAWDRRGMQQQTSRWGPHAARTRTKTRPQLRKWDREAEALGTRARVFCASLADVGDNHRSIDPAWRRDLVEDIRTFRNLDFLLLTKRPQNMPKLYPDLMEEWPSNAWMGATVENQAEANRRIPQLLDLPAPIRFLSCEPLLGAVDLTAVCWKDEGAEIRSNVLTAEAWVDNSLSASSYANECDGVQRIHWVIAGGESGGNARPSHPYWFRSLRDQCAAASVPFLFKQWGEWSPWHHSTLSEGMELSAEDTRQRVNISLLGWVGGNPHMPGDYTMYRAGKVRAGRSLDGVVHDGYPEPHGAANGSRIKSGMTAGE